MPPPAVRFYLHSVARLDGCRTLYVSVRAAGLPPVRLSTGYAVHPENFRPDAPHLLAGAADAHTLNEKLAALQQTLVKACQGLQRKNRLTHAALVPLVEQAIAALGNRPAAPVVSAAEVLSPSSLPLSAQPLRAVLAAWLAGSPTRRRAAASGRQSVEWAERFDPNATPAAIDEPWVKRYTAFLVRAPLPGKTVSRQLQFLQQLVAHTGLPATHIRGGILRQATKCYLTWEEVQQLHLWPPPADKPSLALQKDVFVVRCLCGLSQAAAIALLRTPGQLAARCLPLNGQAPGSAGILRALATMLEELARKYQAWPASQPLPVVSRQQTHHLIGQLLQGAGIDAPYTKVRYKAVVKSRQQVPKWQAASTYTPHHTYAALLARLQLDPLTMHELLGYRDFTSTMAYVLLMASAT